MLSREVTISYINNLTRDKQNKLNVFMNNYKQLKYTTILMEVLITKITPVSKTKAQILITK